MKSPPATLASAASQQLLQRRLGGIAIDFVVMAFIWLVLGALTGGGLFRFAVWLIVAVAIYGIVAGELGTSPGKAVVKLRLVDESGHPPGAQRALIRLAAWVVDGLPCLGLVGGLLIWFTPTHQRVGDTVARTFVVDAADLADEPDPVVAAPPSPVPYRREEPEARADFQPVWDAKLNAYVQWDPQGKRWMRFDDESQQWVAFETL